MNVYYMNGAGNDFMVIDARGGKYDFEALSLELCKLTGAKYAVAVSNGTAALHLACLAINLGPGDEIITTPITFAASANCALYCGARPVFADINPETYNISPESVRRLR